ncbi:MAG: DUF4140 domain-containing protein [Eubacterium sp.]|nr:DUF4140 domain-containing protein [Eubacterium sp.]
MTITGWTGLAEAESIRLKLHGKAQILDVSC